MSARAPLPFSGAQHVADGASLDAWVGHAGFGERLIYCSAPSLIAGPGKAKALELEQLGLVRLAQQRRAGGGFDYLMIRSSKALRAPKAATAAGDPALETILRALKRAANFDRPCPSDAQLAALAELGTRAQAQWRIRKLVESGVIRSMIVTEGGVAHRVVTIAASGKRTALPPKWAALEAARQGSQS